MNNPEKLATFGTQKTWRTQTIKKHNTEKRWAQRTPLKTVLNHYAREKLAVPTSYTVTNIDNSCTNLLSDTWKKKST
jgi:hypothetical protein